MWILQLLLPVAFLGLSAFSLSLAAKPARSYDGAAGFGIFAAICAALAILSTSLPALLEKIR